MFYNNIDPVFVRIGAVEIRYYGLMYVLGFIAGYFLFKAVARKRKLPLSSDDILDFLAYAMIGLIVGARLIYALVYAPAYFASHPLHIFMLWEGGLSFHGGLLGVIFAGLLFCKNKKIDFYVIADTAVIPFAFGLFLGRIGNFLNSELYGRATSLPWGVSFKGDNIFRHPSQLYESAKNLAIFSVLWLVDYKKVPKGFYFWSFITMYSFMRFFIEYVREPEIVIYGLSMGQILNIPMFLLGITMLIRGYIQNAKNKQG